MSATPGIKQQPALRIRKYRFLQDNIFPILVWPIVAGLLLWLLWGLTSASLEHDKQVVREKAFNLATSIVRTYAIQVRHTVEQIDQITLTLKYDWEHTDIVLDLEERKRYGLFPESALLYANIVDHNGDIVTTTFPSTERPNLSDTPYFKAHQSSRTQYLSISGLHPGFRTDRPTIWFSRRLEKPDGTFGGIALVAVEPPFLTSFRDEAILGSGDQIAVQFINGPILALKTSGNMEQVFYRTTPVFSTSAGIAEEPANKFVDQQPRIVAWERLEKYPLMAIALFSEQDIFAAHEARRQSYRNMTGAGSVLLLLFALTGMGFTARLAWRKQQAEEVKVTYRVATDAANEGFYMIRPIYGRDGKVHDYQFEDCNERGAALFGTDRNAIVGHKASELIPEDYRRAIFSIFRRTMQLGFYEDEIRVPQPSRLKASWINRRLVRTNAGLAITMRDISQDKAHEQALATLANTDALTTLHNRHWLTNYLPTAIEQAGNHEAHLAILFIDLDNFKNINDTLGHDAGDELLRQAASRLKKAVRASDHVVRLGGDEFMIILEQVDTEEDVARVAQLVVKLIGESFALAGTGQSHVNASIGISLFPRDGDDGTMLVKHADLAMYAAKAAGKGCYRFYEPRLSDSLK